MTRVAAADANEVVTLLFEEREGRFQSPSVAIATACHSVCRHRTLAVVPLFATPPSKRVTSGIAALARKNARGLVVVGLEAGIGAFPMSSLTTSALTASDPAASISGE